MPPLLPLPLLWSARLPKVKGHPADDFGHGGGRWGRVVLISRPWSLLCRPKPRLMDYHLVPVEEVAHSLGTTPAGLTAVTAQQRLAEHGPNQIADAHRKSVGQLLLRQFTDMMILVLIAAAILAGVVGQMKSTYVILAIVLLNALVGFIQEYRAEKAMAALTKMAASQAQVLRDNQAVRVAAADLVPGDVVSLEAGNVIPADVRFVAAHVLKMDESSLTGESANAAKNPNALLPGEYAFGDPVNLGYKGTFVTNGRGTAYVGLR